MPEAPPQRPLLDSVAVITGGGGGIGRAIAHRLAAAGGKLILTYNQDKEKATTVAEALDGDGHAVMQASVTDSKALSALASTIAQRYGTIDILVNNAGITRIADHGN